MNIKFPKRYAVKHIVGNLFHVDVPAEYLAPLAELLKTQTWITHVFTEDKLHVHGSSAYEYTQDEAHSALCKLAEHIMEPDVDVDPDVWNFDISDGDA